MHTQTLTPLNIKLNKILEQPEDKVAKFASLDSPNEQPLRGTTLVPKLTTMTTIPK